LICDVGIFRELRERLRLFAADTALLFSHIFMAVSVPLAVCCSDRFTTTARA
jgi:hypothetical protein